MQIRSPPQALGVWDRNDFGASTICPITTTKKSCLCGLNAHLLPCPLITRHFKVGCRMMRAIKPTTGATKHIALCRVTAHHRSSFEAPVPAQLLTRQTPTYTPDGTHRVTAILAVAGWACAGPHVGHRRKSSVLALELHPEASVHADLPVPSLLPLDFAYPSTQGGYLYPPARGQLSSRKS